MIRRVTRLLPLLLLLAAACSLPEDPPPQVVITPVPGNAEVRAARALLGEPTVALLDAAVAVQSAIDVARHVVPRGVAQHAALADTEAAVAMLEREQAALSDTLEALPEAPAGAPAARVDALSRARTAVRAMLREADRMIDVVRRSIAPLLELPGLDRRMDEIVAAWGASGSRSERTAALDALRPKISAIEPEARRIRLWPPGCTTMRVNRVTWARLLVQRTAALRDAAADGQGVTYDTLRERYALAPYGEDRAVADSQDRACWERTAGLEDAVATLRAEAEAIGRALG